jgi:hypothetical protein
MAILPLRYIDGGNGTRMRSEVDWRPEIVYWVEDGEPDPDVDWPSNWEVCGYPHLDPLQIVNRDNVRHGSMCLAMPRYKVPDIVQELEHICSFLERMPDLEREKWLALQDRQLTCSCTDTEIGAADMDSPGFHIPGPLLRRIWRLRIRVMIGFHPASNVTRQVIYRMHPMNPSGG